MEYVTRLASTDVASRYPLNVDGRVGWDIDETTPATWVHEILLPDIPPDHIIVPSFAQHEDQYAFRFALYTATESFPLQPVPAAAATAATPQVAQQQDPTASCHIDCWHTHKPLHGGKIRLTVTSASKPQRYLLTLSIRVLESTAPIVAAADNVQVAVAASISQQQAAKEIKNRICSPTALTMALSVFDNAPKWADTVAACYDPLTRAYGSWPLAIQWASQHGIIGAVEALNNWQEAVSILAAGTPLVCSIRFAKDKLAGAPLHQTGGHLVLLYGIEDGHVLAKDPAGATDAEVDRRYCVNEFGEAWLRRRGAAYIFCEGGQLELMSTQPS